MTTDDLPPLPADLVLMCGMQVERCDQIRAYARAAIAAHDATSPALPKATLDCLDFFASVIKSGEPWTDTCKQMLRDALAAHEPAKAQPVSPDVEDVCAILEAKDLGIAEFHAMQLRVAAMLRSLDTERADFHMAYRMQCDEETKRLHIENERLSARIAELEKDAARYRWLRSEGVATDPQYYAFWQEFNTKLCRSEKMDAAVDAAQSKETK